MMLRIAGWTGNLFPFFYSEYSCHRNQNISSPVFPQGPAALFHGCIGPADAIIELKIVKMQAHPKRKIVHRNIHCTKNEVFH